MKTEPRDEMTMIMNDDNEKEETPDLTVTRLDQGACMSYCMWFGTCSA